MSEQEKKKKITLSVTEDTDKKISDLSKKYGMTKSGLVTILVQKANENDNKTRIIFVNFGNSFFRRTWIFNLQLFQ